MYFMPLGAGHPRPAAREPVSDAVTPAGRERLVARWRGVPHTALRAVPAA